MSKYKAKTHHFFEITLLSVLCVNGKTDITYKYSRRGQLLSINSFLMFKQHTDFRRNCWCGVPKTSSSPKNVNSDIIISPSCCLINLNCMGKNS